MIFQIIGFNKKTADRTNATKDLSSRFLKTFLAIKKIGKAEIAKAKLCANNKKIGDLIEAQGEIGVVKEIEIFTTKLIGLSNKEIIIPNGALSNGNIVNYTTEGTRRVDLVFGVGYDSDIKKTKEVLMKVITENPKVLKEPAPTVNVLELADSSVNFAVRPWCKAEDYWAVYFETMENTKEALDAACIEIPYPHQVEIQKKG